MVSKCAAILTMLASMPAWANGPYDCYKAVSGMSVTEGAEAGTFLYTPEMTLRESKINFLKTSLQYSGLSLAEANEYNERKKIIAELEKISVQLRDTQKLPNIKRNYIVSNAGVMAQTSGTEKFEDGSIKVSPAGQMSGVERMQITEDLTALLTKKIKSKLIGWTNQYHARRWGRQAERDSERVSKACMYLIENNAQLSAKLNVLARIMGKPDPVNLTPQYSPEEAPITKPSSAPPSAPKSHDLKNQK